MDPATLFILLKLADCTEKAMERNFVDVERCEAFVAHVIRPRTDVAEIVQYRCASVMTESLAPDWYTKHRPQRFITGVPVGPEHFR
ncbi:MAG TPA: hypothetical protein PK271_04785 [Hyphomicrobium sp.]|uniref:hypothetical protein n=1 Tax=Hyphomicrobium sp. TaxID=82 RepID=UPI002C9F9C5B|nr:hypothetical protein [Hyphomicrobium sp.]HRN87897.1 hypothetical protein [Hyphomicrobium sp.]